MNYMLLIYESEAGFAKRSNPSEAATYMGGWMAYSKAIVEAGIFVAGAGLQLPDTATTVRMPGGPMQVQDGPFADSKEQLGGFFIINVPDLDTALAWAKRAPLAGGGSMEVRPTLPPPPQL